MKKRIMALTLALSLFLTSCGGGAKATTMRLRRTEGQVSVSDDGGKDVEPRDNLGLYSGYGVETKRKSFAWIDLDEVKLAKLDEKSEIEINKDGKDLEIMVSEGSLFFNVTEPLTDDESMNIRTSTMAVGIRGTCGWVVSKGGQGSQVFILEGTVEAEALDTGETVSVSAGEMAEVAVNEDGKMEITVLSFSEEYVAPFVLTELEDDEELSAAVLEASGLDVLNPPDPAERLRGEYEAIIKGQPILDNYLAEGDSYTSDGITYVDEGLSYAAIIDLDGDGSEELLLVMQQANRVSYVSGSFRKLEVYGALMGHAVLRGEAAFREEDFLGSLPPNRICLLPRDGHVYVSFNYEYQHETSDRIWGIEDDALVLVEQADGFDMLSDQFLRTETDWTYTEAQNLCPSLPAQIQRQNAFLGVLTMDYTWPAFAKLTGEGENMELYFLDAFDVANLCKYTWNGAELEYTNLKNDIGYAKLIDMNQDGKEELLLVDTNDGPERNTTVYSWEGSGIRKTELNGGWMGMDGGLYHDKATGDIYIGSSWPNGYDFAGLTDSVFLSRDGFGDGVFEYYIDDRQVEQDEYYAQVDRFELIENIDFNSSTWVDALDQTVEAVKQKLMER